MKLRKKGIFNLLFGLVVCVVFIQIKWSGSFTSSKALGQAASRQSPKSFTERKPKVASVVARKNNSSPEWDFKAPLRKAIKLDFGPVYMFGAVAGNTTPSMSWDSIKVYGVINTTFYKDLPTNLSCCLMYRTASGINITHVQALNTWMFWAEAIQRVFHLTCPNMRYHLHGIPERVGLSLPRNKCNVNNIYYIKTLVPLKETGVKLAIGTQIAFGNINADHIIDWMETYKYLGVNKVISYYYKLTNEKALKVLQYYQKTGFVDLYRYQPAGEEMQPRDFHQKDEQLYNDLQLVVKDSLERMSGYTYFGIIDLDEFLIPSKNRSLKEMLANLRKVYRNAAGFAFKSQYFFTSWGRSGRANDMIFGQYINRSALEPMLDHPKQICMPEYISYGNMHVHGFVPVKGFERIIVPATEGFIRHFRQIRQRWNFTNYMNNVKRVTDTSLAHWSMRLKENVHVARKAISKL